ncbi:MAG: hypothetical protein ABIR27_07245 [Dokdonella sp.]
MDGKLSDRALGRRSRTPWIIGGIVALALLLVVAAAGGVVWFGLGLFQEQAHTAIRADPAIADAVGNVTAIDFDVAATAQATGDDEFAYRIEGERGRGLLVARFITLDADTEELREGSLRLDDGRVVRVGTALRPD